MIRYETQKQKTLKLRKTSNAPSLLRRSLVGNAAALPHRRTIFFFSAAIPLETIKIRKRLCSEDAIRTRLDSEAAIQIGFLKAQTQSCFIRSAAASIVPGSDSFDL
ncbi:hypothetical protein A2U01_0048995 [Trifolium medium]|uniref:Uncharacterized protein n=1 Tax=Trifolium medium TaxID=97028 RepID=A0A392QX25_9FABA|nr:hypothetical protein [Trifolium medium]